MQEIKYNENEIVKRCQSGDLHAFELVYQKYRDSLFRVAFRMLKSKEDCEDALQMTFIRLYKSMNNFRSEAKLSTYIFKILSNVCRDFYRKKRCINTDSQKELIFQPQNELQIHLDEAIQMLPDKMRECFILFAIEGFKQFEIAEMLDITVGTVKAHIFRAKEKLKESLKGELEYV